MRKSYRRFRLAMIAKQALMTSCISLLIAGSVNSQSAVERENKLEIERAILNWEAAWKTKDFRLAAQDYSIDADWTNAFGMTRRGRVEIESMLKEVFALPFVMEGNSKTVEQTVRFLKPDLATVVTRVEREGQKLPTGEAMPVRKTSHLRVFMRLGKKWKIVSHLISDARDTERRGH